MNPETQGAAHHVSPDGLAGGTRRQKRWPLLVGALWLAALACGRPPVPPLEPTTSESTEAARPYFIDRTADSGLEFVHFNGMVGDFFYSEMMGPGVALFDYDQDGDLDIYAVQGDVLTTAKDPLQPPEPAMLPLHGRLYRNDLKGAGETPQFVDVTAASRLEATGYGMGAAVGDLNRDGWPDLILTFANGLQIWSGSARGTFERQPVPVGHDVWLASASVADYDADGWPDLYLTAYVDFDIARHKLCRTLTGSPDYCGPLAYEPQSDILLRNLGRSNETFRGLEDVSVLSGIGKKSAAGLGVVAGDFNQDRRLDFYVANDGMANFLWVQQEDGTFRDEALLSGTALNGEGQAEAGMGVVAVDLDGDADEDLLLTHLALETNTLYRNGGEGFFVDGSLESGLATPSWSFTGFGLGLPDIDKDGWLDVMTVNGGVRVIPELLARADPHPIHMRNQLFHNLGAGRFEEIDHSADTATSPLSLSEVSRGVATGDLDNDGDSDVIVAHNNGPLRLWINQADRDLPWLGLDLRLADGTLATYAEATIRTGERRLYRRVRRDGSYLSSSDPRILFGLGSVGSGFLEVDIHWPDGQRETVRVDTGRYHRLQQGSDH